MNERTNEHDGCRYGRQSLRILCSTGLALRVQEGYTKFTDLLDAANFV